MPYVWMLLAAAGPASAAAEADIVAKARAFHGVMGVYAKNLDTGAVEITSQNHGFAVAEESLPKNVRVTHRSLNDGTVEGLDHQEVPAFSVQYHPEASAGPHDSHYLFQRFLATMQS